MITAIGDVMREAYKKCLVMLYLTLAPSPDLYCCGNDGGMESQRVIRKVSRGLSLQVGT